MTTRLDAIDVRILKTLQNDGKITNVALADLVGLTPPPTLRRVKELETQGFIGGYTARLDRARLGFDVTAFALVQLHGQSEAQLQAFEKFVQALPQVRCCHQISGETDFHLTCITRDHLSFQDLVRQLTGAPNVKTVRTLITIKEAKNEPGLPLQLYPPPS